MNKQIESEKTEQGAQKGRIEGWTRLERRKNHRKDKNRSSR